MMNNQSSFVQSFTVLFYIFRIQLHSIISLLYFVRSNFQGCLYLHIIVSRDVQLEAEDPALSAISVKRSFRSDFIN